VTCISTICFIIRATILFLTAYISEWDRFVFLLLSYYLAVEIIPIALVLLVLNRRPVETSIDKEPSSTDSIIPSSASASYGSLNDDYTKHLAVPQEIQDVNSNHEEE